MVKRKNSANGDNVAKSNKKVKKLSEANNNVNQYGKIDCKNSEAVIKSILGDNVKEFFSNYWEKKPYFIKRENTEFYGDLFNLSEVKDILKNHELNFETDVNVTRYLNEEKEVLNEDGRVTGKKFDALMKNKQATFQIHQPQRFSDNLWNAMEKLETYFGSLVGANIYVTPPSSQGLAPHCDDVEIFVLQLEGKKTWKLYKPMVELSRDYTQDLDEASIGEPFFTETLKPGDLLYFPRGTIYQAKSTDDGPSLHISISTYQQNTWGDFMNHAITQAIDEALEDDVSIRSGLPLNYSSFLGTAKNLGKYVTDDSSDSKKKLSSNENVNVVKEFRENVKQHLLKLMDHIDVNMAADSMCADFMASRLPPHGHVVKEDDEADRQVPTLESKIKIRYPDHVRVVYSSDDVEDEELSQIIEDDDSDMEEDEEEKEEEQEEKPATKSPKKSPKKKSNGEEKAESKAIGDKKSENKSSKKESKKTPVKSETEADDEDDDEDVDPEEDEPCIQIVHSLNNDREMHMIGDNMADFTGKIKFPVHFGRAAIALLESKDFMFVKDLDLDEDDDKLTLATSLFADDLIEIV
ncbi:ribosomal oxygenase 2-like [Hydractinia symbiolongicarpus]|uniref:ribosomal oxygenase 2-like n=1 Tax=Hydractinia symbiolongicarpus TaxID=13093 RepID=UPI00254ADFDA|nr:ribosomal oxygenase 2-like [Hydractinia symbiolongicarpus]